MTDLRKAAEMALEAMETLWDILDDIDTASDMAKENDAWYRKRVEALQKKRWDTTITTDGYKLKGGPVEALRQALAQPVQVLTAKVVVTGIEHESWCDSVTKLLLSMPPQIPWAMQQEREAIITWLVEDGFFVKDGTLSEQVREKLHHSIYFDVNRRKTPEVTPEVTGDVGACVTCGAPKGEWLVDAVNMSQERVDETAKCKREWVGLTDEEVESWRGNYDFFDSALVREVEAKLKEKNR